MTKSLAPTLCLLIIACGGSLPDEQRKAMRERIEANKIVRVTDAELTEAAFEQGRNTVRMLDSIDSDSSKLKAYLSERKGIRFVAPGSADALMLEQQLIDAYLSDPSGTFTDNVQKVRNEKGDFDTLLYTKPITKKLADGREELIGVWNIWLPKKELVLEIGRRQ